jgi:hypothetical protein
MIERQIDSPMPIPSDFVVKKGWKIRLMVPVSIPVPESSTATSAPLDPCTRDLFATRAAGP